jgi:protein-S-isoprenylcysteine O-methyltransferase Ste14
VRTVVHILPWEKEIAVKRIRTLIDGLHPYLLSSIAGALTVVQIVLAVLARGPRCVGCAWAGWICLWTSSIFGIVPVFAFRRKGGVESGQSYTKTTTLVDSGMYGIVRHPQNGTAWLLISLGLMLITQHWASLILGLISMLLAYADTFKADQRCIAKFGDPYRTYMQRVPRVNFVAGLVRLARRPAGAKSG